MGNKLVDSSNANFVGKVSGSTTANPHVAKYASSNFTSLKTPSEFLSEFAGGYASISNIDNSTATTSLTTNGGVAQHLISFNLIEHIQRTYGPIPGATTSDKVAWLKLNISKLTLNWWGFGSGVGGNKATIASWNITTSSWGNHAQNSTGATGKLSKEFIVSEISNRLDASGFIYLLAYAESSDGTTPSVINTDYVELNVELSTGIWNNTPAFTWINATYQNSWASFDADRALKYAKDEKGMVTLRGTVKSGTVGTATPVMTLPAGFRPLESSLSIPITVSGGIGELQIQSSGAVSIASASYGASPNPSTQAHIYVRFFAGQ